MIHQLKLLPCHYVHAHRGIKKFEIRDNSDRGFQAGDTVSLHEYDPKNERATGQFILADITYVTNFAQKENWVVFGFSVTHADEPTEDLLPDPERSWDEMVAAMPKPPEAIDKREA